MSARLEFLDAGLSRVVAGFTTRAGGVSVSPWDELNLALHVGDRADDALANRDLLAFDLNPRALVFAEQVHGAAVHVVESGGSLRVPEADAMVTAQPRVALAVLVADCMPVLFADPVVGIVAAAHAGRRGLAAGVLQATLTAMVDLGAELPRIAAVIGPAICGRCYEVPAEMRDEVDAAVPGTACVTARGTAGLDLPVGAVALLSAHGVTATSVGICTAEDRRFFSYRRDGVTGRFAGVVMLASDG